MKLQIPATIEAKETDTRDKLQDKVECEKDKYPLTESKYTKSSFILVTFINNKPMFVMKSTTVDNLTGFTPSITKARKFKNMEDVYAVKSAHPQLTDSFIETLDITYSIRYSGLKLNERGQLV